MRTVAGKRVLSIWLPRLPLDRWRRKGDGRLAGAFAIIDEVNNSWRVTHPSDEAIRAGVRMGLTLPDARAICPDLLTEPADAAREDALLRALWRWADVLSPRVALDAPDGLLLDIAGCAHLFGGEEALAVDAIDRLEAVSVAARTGIADSKGAARALARFSSAPVAIAEPGRTGAALAPLPVGALGVQDETASALARAGLKTIGQLYEVKTSELARRFGLSLTGALAAALGQTADPVTPASADPIYAARMTLPDPVGLLSDIEAVLQRLAASVCGRLEQDRKGARAFTLTVRCVDTGDHHLSAGFARPCFDAKAILQQFAHPLSKLRIEFGADGFRLAASHVEPVRHRQADIDDRVRENAGVAQLLTTLGNRIGFDHVRAFAARDSHQPDREFDLVEAVDRRSALAWAPAPRKRPLRLFRPPEPLHLLDGGRPPRRFQWRGAIYALSSAKGPERLTPEWWRTEDLRTRDYWTVDTADGARFWLLTYPGKDEQSWFVAGRFP